MPTLNPEICSKLRTRFAPSPTGLLHIGNAYSALICQQWSEKEGAELLLRIEDIDFTRCKTEYHQQLMDDLKWLGIKFHGEIVKQSDRHRLYRKALEKLQSMGVIYPCFCTRKHIREEIERMGIAPHAEDEADPYPGTCRHLYDNQNSSDDSKTKMKHEPFAWRLDAAKAMKLVGDSLTWRDQHNHQHPVTLSQLGDVVIGRKDIEFSYHLAVVVDDADQGISHVIRGKDLLPSTPVHCLLQRLLGLPTPVYIHHRLLADRRGERLTKRNRATALKELEKAGCNPKLLRSFLLKNDHPEWPFVADDIVATVEELGSAS